MRLAPSLVFLDLLKGQADGLPSFPGSGQACSGAAARREPTWISIGFACRPFGDPAVGLWCIAIFGRLPRKAGSEMTKLHDRTITTRPPQKISTSCGGKHPAPVAGGTAGGLQRSRNAIGAERASRSSETRVQSAPPQTIRRSFTPEIYSPVEQREFEPLGNKKGSVGESRPGSIEATAGQFFAARRWREKRI